ncbi:hypothetical protein ACTEYT_10205 (plasmid) [Limosilactobacillus reuteri]|uniref:Uncharacterized protein n=1 Tax=Limosilactobacillus reuteri subsp. suis (strain ATCC 53608 / LMG 31752 / 1063) TaxID=927703 RepID=F8KGF1_LIMR5|nr:conserved hypothetical protein [Limosilactobacillus reuteri subsp. suis]CUU13522.1 hypothetical protein predicted by prodigal [Limosilactobacillus reuteri subsp. suis]
METIVHDPLNRITAKEANLRATKQKENAYKETLKRVYGAIHANVSLGRFETEQIIDGFEEADYVFNQLVMKDEYAVTLGAVNSDPDDERMKVTISWDSESLIDPNKKYILPMEGTEEHGCPGETTQGYAYKNRRGIWTICHVFGAGGIMDERVVTAKDLEEAPEWVKAIEPVEVEG